MMNILRNLSFKIKRGSILFFVAGGSLSFSACDKEGSEAKVYDPNMPLVADDFYPKTGGMMSGIILSGKNFGSDPKKIKVYFNEKQAVVTGASGEHIQALAPRLPGDICKIAVVIGKDSVVYDETFQYERNFNLSILAGQPTGSGTAFIGGPLSSTYLNPSLRFLAIDPFNNLYVSMTGAVGARALVYVNEEQSFSRWIADGTATTDAPMGGVWVPERELMVVPSHNNGYYWEIDPQNAMSTVLRQYKQPENDQVALGYVKPTNPLNWFYSFVYSDYQKTDDPLYNASEGFIYSRTYNGMLFRFRLSNRVMSMVTHQCPTGAGDTYIAGDPFDNTKIYCSTLQNHRISVIDISKAPNDPEFEKVIIGLPGTGAHQDGHVSIARLNRPYQVVVTKDLVTGNKIMYIADSGNRVVRKYDFETEIITTIAGTPGQTGLTVGNPDQSRMGDVRGLVVNSEGDLYISDVTNKVILKLAFQ